jgi:hypothetical protein
MAPTTSFLPSPFIQREDEEEFAGRFRSRNLVLGGMTAFTFDDPDSCISATPKGWWSQGESNP